MPVYEYRCANGHRFERLLPIREYAQPQTCRCGSPADKHIFSPPRVFSDYEGYESPGTGKWVEGRVARQKDLQECNCRPYEEGEREEAQRRAAAEERRLDAFVDNVVEETMHELTA